MASGKVASILVISEKFSIFLILIGIVFIYFGTRHEYVPSEINLTGYKTTWRYTLRVNQYTGGSCLFDGGTQQVEDELLNEYIPQVSCEDVKWFNLYY